MARTSPKRARYFELSNFLGVDFANEETEVDVRRSPYAPNMVADRAGRPEKRAGYKQICSFEGHINGIHFFDGDMIVHAGTDFYDAEGNLLYENANDARSISFVMGLEEIADEISVLHHSLYILDGANYLHCIADGQQIALHRLKRQGHTCFFRHLHTLKQILYISFLCLSRPRLLIVYIKS